MSQPFFHHLNVPLDLVPIPKARRGFKFTIAKLKHLLEAAEEVIPISNPDWDQMWQEH
jgi:hypothetical protein